MYIYIYIILYIYIYIYLYIYIYIYNLLFINHIKNHILNDKNRGVFSYVSNIFDTVSLR